MSAAAPTRNVRATARSVAPLITMGAAWGARKAMSKGFEAKTGRPAPLVRSRHASIVEKILWAAAMASVLALIEALVYRALDDEED
ncbi:MAG: DUF4235 domain-containing protein [Candidatus Nanopelagicales bacterium]|jgi:hypothetical protein|nr:DUF4235 domain-containing protein [Candidatus Nanopelagicales bacterium]